MIDLDYNSVATVEFSDLVSQERDDRVSELTGASFEEQHFPDSWGETGKSQCCTFVLNGETYTAVEDPSDGYRSSMRMLMKGGTCSNMFPPVLVRVERLDKRPTEPWENTDYQRPADLLCIVDIFTGKPVLTIGTDNSDDYYPSFVSHFQPENMVYNVTVR